MRDAGTLLDLAGLGHADLVLDVAGTAPEALVAAHARWDCAVAILDLDREGGFAGDAGGRGRAAAARAALLAAGVPGERIALWGREADLRPADLLLNLEGFGAGRKVKRLAPVLARAVHSASVMLTDIRKGSGAFPFLRAHGETEALLETTDAQGRAITRARFRPGPPAQGAPGAAQEAAQDEAQDEAQEDEAAGHAEAWASVARDLAGEGGFYRAGPEGHSVLFVPRGEVLVVTFDNLDIAMGKREDRRPWGFDFIARQGWSMLGVMAGGWTWYREPWVHAEFDRLAAEGFFARFSRVVFYGASMGGYAAAAFSAACPGADVVAISPQSTLARDLVPWESRYRTAWARDFSGPYGDAAVASAAARRVILLYDPHEALDAAHAARFAAPNVVRLRAPLLGHRLGSSLAQMGVLTPIILGALEGTLGEAEFYRRLRARRDFPRYQRELFARAAPRHPRLAAAMARSVLARMENRPLRAALARLPGSEGGAA